MKDTIQFFHDKEHGATYAVDVIFDKEDLIETIHNFNKLIVLQVGVSNVHPNDPYIKKVGRELSSQRLKPIDFKLDRVYHIYSDNDKLFINYYSESAKLYIKFRINAKSDKPHLIQVS